MAYVDIWRAGFEADELIARLVLGDNNRVDLSGLPEGYRKYLEKGIELPDGRRVLPTEGVDFLAAVQLAFTGSRIRASGVKY